MAPGAAGVGQHERVAAVGLGLTRVEVGGAAHDQPRHVRHRHAAAGGDTEHEPGQRAGLVDDQSRGAEGLGASEERLDVGLVVRDGAGEQRRACLIQHIGEVLGLAAVEADPHGGFVGRTHCDSFRGFPLIPAGRPQARSPSSTLLTNQRLARMLARAEQCRSSNITWAVRRAIASTKSAE